MVTTSSWSPTRSRVSAVGVNASSSRTTRLTVGAARQPQLAQVDAVQPGARRHAYLQQVGAQLVQRGGVDLDLLDGSPADHAEPARHERQRRALQEGEHDDEHEHGVDSPARSARPRCSGMSASTIGTAPRSPDHDRNACSRHGTRNGAAAAIDRERPRGHQQHDHAGDQRGHDGVDAAATGEA